MKNKPTKFRPSCLLLALLMSLSLASCSTANNSSDNTEKSTLEETTEETTATTKELISEDFTEEVTTGTDNNAAKPVALQVKWNFGYVASATHASTPNQIVSAGSMYSYTDVFTIPKAGTTITFTDDNTNANGDAKYASASAYVVSSWKQENGTWVLDADAANYSGSTSTASDIVASFTNGALVYSYTTTVDNENLRLCYRSGQSASFTPSSYPTVYAEYTGREGTAAVKLNLKAWLEGTKQDYYNDVLKGITINALGDSYFAGQGLSADYIWLNLLAKKYDITMNNYGKGGSTISNFVTTNDPMCQRYTTMANNDPQIVLLEGGRNDFNQKTPIGTAGSTDTKTFIGALNVTIDGIQAKYPNAMIVLISPWNFPDKSGYIARQDYIDAMKQVAEAQGVYFIDASNSAAMGVDMTNSSFRSTYCLTSTDVSHLNPEGMKLVMPKFEKYIAEFYTDFLAKQQ